MRHLYWATPTPEPKPEPEPEPEPEPKPKPKPRPKPNQVVPWHPSQQQGVVYRARARPAEHWRDSALPSTKYGKQARHPAHMLPRGSVGRSRGFARSQRLY